MFIPLLNKPVDTLRPAGSAISPSDWSILSNHWYPVAIARELLDAPLAVTLLDVDLVLFRGTDGSASAAIDACPHRHVRLSIGKVVDGQIVCPFHGLHFNQDGRCTYVPALGPRNNLPPSYKVRTFEVRERYGLLWTCIGEQPLEDVPLLPLIAKVPADELDYLAPEIWPVSAARQVENFIDIAHLPYVHAATLGGDQAAPIKPGRIEQQPDGVLMRANYVETNHGIRHCAYTYRVVLPFAIEFKVEVEGDADFMLESCDLPSPISAHQCKVFQILRYGGSREERAAMCGGLAMVNREDMVVLGAMRIPDLPLDQHHEIHLPVDNISNAYRGRLRDLGLGR
ncbi:Rieske 2Fe-2S domain-containing protein [Pseudomonas sp. LRF_L74]|uniref:Rieske 2Fe-2S domain-containing protein n=1 Tax=Pseudomonas sp. LRF_L74 TaxID=3369422 RepID=UPI003F5DA248